MEEATQTPITTPEAENNVMTFDSIKAMKAFRAQQLHQQRIQKKRQERWSQPAAHAKIEDLMLVGQDIRQIFNNHDILVKLLVKKGIITDQELEEQAKYEKERLAKFLELKENTTMTADEKKAAAQEWNIPLDMLGLSETASESNGENIPESTEQAQ